MTRATPGGRLAARLALGVRLAGETARYCGFEPLALAVTGRPVTRLAALRAVPAALAPIGTTRKENDR